mmetsp:Transcript_31762/g.78733  ORF Transcript_31762/g.78733 Transcript_31762/m.78733 type:complete len:87 (+) Transcript_31762:875-1135(+)
MEGWMDVIDRRDGRAEFGPGVWMASPFGASLRRGQGSRQVGGVRPSIGLSVLSCLSGVCTGRVCETDAAAWRVLDSFVCACIHSSK